MIQIEDTREIPRVAWNEQSSKEFLLMPDATREEFIRRSDPVKVVKHDDEVLALCGVYQQSLLGTKYFWALLAEAFAQAPVSVLREMILRVSLDLPSGETFVEEAQPKADRLARLFRFYPSDSTIIHGDRVFRAYRRA